MAHSRFHRTVAFEVQNVLVDKHGNIHPDAETVLQTLVNLKFHVILWTGDKNFDIREYFQFNKESSVKVLPKPKKPSEHNQPYHVVDYDFEYGSLYKLWSVVPFFDINRSKSENLKKIVSDYIKIVNGIEVRIGKNKKD